MVTRVSKACRCKNHIDIRESVAFITINDILSSRRNTTNSIKWLDMCCGNGNILTHIKKGLRKNCSRVQYYGLDLDLAHIKECKEIIRKERLKRSLAVCEAEVWNVVKQPITAFGNIKYDIVTILNVLHEIPPFDIYTLLSNAIGACKSTGQILIVDMCTLPHLEWQAITWEMDHLEKLISPLITPPMISQNPYPCGLHTRTVDIFTLKLLKRKINLKLVNSRRQRNRKGRLYVVINNCLRKKRKDLAEKIKAIYSEFEASGESAGPAGISNHNNDIKRSLWEYWAVSNALDEKKG